MDGRAISFGPYRLLAARRVLLEGDKPVRLGSRAFDILTALVERAGEVVSKGELIARAWPKTFVEEANLKIQVSALRRALGDGQGDNRYVATVVGRGYNFVAPIRNEEPSRALPSPTITPAALHNLPFATTRMIGREGIATALVTQLSHQRLVTVVGPGGIGKTTVGLAVAERMIGAYEHGVWLVDLAPLRDSGLVLSAVATVLGLEIHTEDPLPALVAALRDKRMLLILDNCEHVIDAAAGLAAAVLSGTSGVTLLATSREPLGVQGERVHRLGPLNSPEPSSTLTAAEAAASPAVQLFVERVTAIVETFALTDANALLVVEICRRLDGLPLAIEFAAPHVETLGVEGLATRLDDLPLLGARRRATTPRHRTMRAVIDWSYGLLSEDEQLFFRRLGIFAGVFTGEAAAAVAMDAATAGADAIDRLADLVAKSLVVADVGGTRPRFRLLETTRAYALEKLAECGEAGQTARRHVEFYLSLFAPFSVESRLQSAIDDLSDHRREIDNLRAALNWAFSPDTALGIEFAAAATHFWAAGSLLAESCEWAGKALAQIGGATGTRVEMILQCSLGMALIYTQGMSAHAREALVRALKLAEQLEDFDYRQRASYGLCLFSGRTLQFKAALAVARRYEEVAHNRDLASGATAAWLVGLSETYLAAHIEASEQLQRAIDQYPVERRGRDMIRFGADLRASAFGHLAVNFLSRGLLDRASRAAMDAIEEARRAKQPVVLCLALAWAVSLVFPRLGDLDMARSHSDELVDHAQSHLLRPFHAIGVSARGALAAICGDHEAGIALLRSGLAEMQAADYRLFYPFFQAELAAALGAIGRIDDGLATIDEALRLAVETDYHWFVPEILRSKGELHARCASNDQAKVADLFRQSMTRAREQQALYWELRAATSLARLLRDQGRPADAIACLQPIYDRFMEGFGTADLAAAKQLLVGLGVAGHLSAPLPPEPS